MCCIEFCNIIYTQYILHGNFLDFCVLIREYLLENVHPDIKSYP